MKSKSPAPAPVPQPVVTPVAPQNTKPIERAATNAEARDRAESNPSANLLAPAGDEQPVASNKAGMMGTY